MIQYLKQADIDKIKWDLCIGQSLNSMVYGYSWYLNMVAPNWEGLVLNDYEAVMPLTCNRKLFINYLYQPFFTQQLGVFYKSGIAQQLVIDFVNAIPQKFKFIDINLNEANEFLPETIAIKKRKNYILNLSEPHHILHKEYDEHCKRNIKKAKRLPQTIKPVDAALAVAFYQKYKGEKTDNVTPTDYQHLLDVLLLAEQKSLLLPRGIYNAQQELVAVGVFIIHQGRIIYLLGCSSPKGRESRAMYLLFDDVILHFSNNPMVLDFEGSELSGIARFFKGFGAVKKPYYKLYVNRLPWFMKWLK